MREKFIRFMYGRYGLDSLGKCLFITAIVLSLCSSIIKSSPLNLIAWILIFYSYYRVFSRNISKRAAENQTYLSKTYKIRTWWYKQIHLIKQKKTHHIYKCPTCKQKIRIPKGKGRIEISCPKCRTTFIKNS